MPTDNDTPGLFDNFPPGGEDHFSASPTGDKIETKPKEPEAKPEPEPQPEPAQDDAALAELRAQNEALQKRFEDQQRVVEAALTRPAQPEPARMEPLDPGPAPDPITKPDEHRKWLDATREYDRQKVQFEMQGELDELRRQNQLNALWSDFQREHADVAKDPALVAAAFSVESQRYGGQIPNDTESFMTTIADRLRALRGSEDPGPTNETRPDANRTRGLSPRSAPAPSKPGEQEKEPDESVTFADQLRQLQVDSGFF